MAGHRDVEKGERQDGKMDRQTDRQSTDRRMDEGWNGKREERKKSTIS